jgi:hypothetical protein
MFCVSTKVFKAVEFRKQQTVASASSVCNKTLPLTTELWRAAALAHVPTFGSLSAFNTQAPSNFYLEVSGRL